MHRRSAGIMFGSEPRKTTAWPMVLLLWAVGLLAAAQFAKVSLTLEWLARLYPDAPVAWLVSAVSAIGIMFGAFAGYAVAWIGARRAVLWAVGVSAAASCMQILPLSFPVLMITRAVEGVGHLGFVVALPTLMAALAQPKDKPVVMGLWGTFFGVAFAIMAFVAPVISSVDDLRFFYAGHGVVLALVFPIMWRSLPRGIGAGAALPNFIALHRVLYTSARFTAPGLGHGIYASLFIALVAFLPAALDALWLVPVLPLANLSGTLMSGFLARWIPASRLSPGSFLVAAGLFAGLWIVPSPVLATIALFATGVTAGANFAAVPELNTTPERQARANGAMAQLGNVGTFSGTPIFAFAAGAGLPGLMGMSVAICLLGAICAGWLYARARMSVENGT